MESISCASEANGTWVFLSEASETLSSTESPRSDSGTEAACEEAPVPTTSQAQNEVSNKGDVVLCGKAKGKGHPPPLPVAKGKGIASAFPVKGTGKGLLKAEVKPRIAAVPPHLQAPGPRRIHMSTPSCKGSIWESLRPWDVESPAVLPGLDMNYEALLAQWALAAKLSASPQVPMRQVSIMSELLVKSLSLNPDLVRSGLCEDLDALSIEQWQALGGPLADTFERDSIRLRVQEMGEAGLSSTEAVLWAMEKVPMHRQLVCIGTARHTLAETLAKSHRHVAQLESLAEDLGNSRALRTILQACLIASNVLCQSGNSQLTVEALAGLHLRKLHPDAPSLLNLVARDLEMMPSESSQESPWDAVTLLKRCLQCRVMDVEDWLKQEGRACSKLIKSIRTYDSSINTSGGPLLQEQVRQLSIVALKVSQDTQECQERLGVAAQSVLDLFGGSAPRCHEPCRLSKVAGAMLDNIGMFGTRLGNEMERAANNHKLMTSSMGGLPTVWSSWEPVATNEISLRRTQDPDLVRLLRNGQHGSSEYWMVVSVGGKDAVEENGNKDLSLLMRHGHLLHGGPDGEYRRCSVTGKWMPVGYAATIADRDCGERGANAGFFVTY